MLSILASGLPDKIITDKKPSIAIYQALIEHIERAAGKIVYPKVPKYKLTSSGEVQYVGRLDANPFAIFSQRIIHQLYKSYLFSRILFKFLDVYGYNQKDINLFIQIIKKSKQLFVQKYNGSFYVVLWTDKSDLRYDYVFSELKRNQIEVIATEAIFNKYNYPIEECFIKGDNHPSKFAYTMIADYLLGYIK